MDKSVVNLSASFNLEFYYPWELTILIGWPACNIAFSQKSTKRVNTVVSSGICRFYTKAQEVSFVV